MEANCVICLYKDGQLDVQRMGRTLLTESQERRNMLDKLEKHSGGPGKVRYAA